MSRYGRNAYEALKTNKLAPKKRFGQNFLVHRQTAEAIVRAGGVTADDIILEVGVGLGALTVPLAAVAKHVYGYEIDSGIIRFHQEQGDLPENVTLVHQDILQADFKEIAHRCGGKLKILANLPYSISNPFIFTLIDNAAVINTATVMLQKEVAERLMARPKSKDYGVPTVLLASCASVRKVMTLNPGEFHPKPKVDSVVVEINFSNPSQLPGADERYNLKIFKQIVKATFNQRRKTIQNTLSNAGFFGPLLKQEKHVVKEHTLRIIERAGLQPNARPETLNITDFIKLAVEVEKTVLSLMEE